MNDLIERSEVFKQLRLNHKDVVYIDKKECARRIEAIPPADAVEVVRCKDCKYKSYGVDYMWCDHAQGLANSIKDDDFCSYGERKES